MIKSLLIYLFPVFEFVGLKVFLQLKLKVLTIKLKQVAQHMSRLFKKWHSANS